MWDWCEFWWYEFSTAAQDWGGSWRGVWSTTSCPGGGKRITLWIWRTDQVFDVYEAAPSAAEVDRLKPEALEPLRPASQRSRASPSRLTPYNSPNPYGHVLYHEGRR